MFHRFHDLKGGPGPQDPEMVNNRNGSRTHLDTMEAVIYNSLLCSDDIPGSQQHVIQGPHSENMTQQHPIPTSSPEPEYSSQGGPATAHRQILLATGQKMLSGSRGSQFLSEHYGLSPSEPEQHFTSFNTTGERRVASHTIPNVTDNLRTSSHIDLAMSSNQSYLHSVDDQRNNSDLHRKVTEFRRTPADYKRLSYNQQEHGIENSLNRDNYSISSQKQIANSKLQIQESHNHSMQYSEHQILNSQRLDVNSPRYHLVTQNAKSGYQNLPEVHRISQSVKPQDLEEQSPNHSNNSQKVSREADNQIVEIHRHTVGNHSQKQKQFDDSRENIDIENPVKSQGNLLDSERSFSNHTQNDDVCDKHSDIMKHPERYLPSQSIRPVILKQEIDNVKHYEKRVHEWKLQDGGNKNLEPQMSKSLPSHQTVQQDLHGNDKTYGQYTEEGCDGSRVRHLESYESFEKTETIGDHETAHDNGSPTYSREVFSRNGAEDFDMMHNVIYPRPKLSKGKHPKQYICSICEMSFKNGTQLKNHAWRHTGEKPFSCETCLATFTQHSNLKTHMRIHTGERPYVCQECNATFTQISNLRTHLKIHSGEKPFECEDCGIKFSQQSNLKSHKLIHTGERPFQCVHCDASFVQSTHLRNHQRIHTDERPYPCEQCGAKFRQLSNLKTHEKIHTGERPHVCPNCGSAFAQKSNLKSHILKLHAPDGSSPSRRGRKKKLEPIIPHYCNICGAKFTLISNLKIHTKLHTGEKPYSCTTCEATFAQKSNLKSHEMTHTYMKPHQCDECEAAFRQKTNLRTHKLKKHSPMKSSRLKNLSEAQYETNKVLNDSAHSPYDTSHF